MRAAAGQEHPREPRREVAAGADMQADAAGPEQRQPRARERVTLAEAQLTVGELEQETEVGSAISEHEWTGGARSPSGSPVDVDSRETKVFSLLARHTNPTVG